MYTPNGECSELSIPNIVQKLSARETDESAGASEDDRACYSTSDRLFASKQEAGGRSCLFLCRCRSCFRELPLTSTPGVSNPLWLSAPTPVRHFFSSPCYTSSMSAKPRRPAPPASLGADALAAGRAGGAHTHLHTHTHTHTPRAPSEGLNTVLRTCGAAVKNQRSCPGRFALSRLIENELRKMSSFFSLSVL